jgi:hypothetical protein
MGGAYTALAEGIEGAAVNAAAPSVREPFSYKWLDYDVSLGLQFPGTFARTDFDNRGRSGTAGEFLKLDAGLQLQFGKFGTCLTADLQRYVLKGEGSEEFSVLVGRWRAVASYGLLNDQLHIGGGVRVLTMEIQKTGGPLFELGTALRMVGASPEVGALLMPNGLPWRIGATFRFGVTNNFGFLENRQSVPGLFHPRGVTMPWELEVGGAVQLGPRPLNPAWLNPREQEAPLRSRIERARWEREQRDLRELAGLSGAARERRQKELEADEEAIRRIEDLHIAAESKRLLDIRKARYLNWPREKVLLLASVLITGESSDQAVSVQQFLEKDRDTSIGASVSFTPRLGLEGEPIAHRLRGRVGTYVEPSRYGYGTPRQHFTFGGDVRLFDWNIFGLLADTTWRATLLIDVAPRYTNVGISFGPWH